MDGIRTGPDRNTDLVVRGGGNSQKSGIDDGGPFLALVSAMRIARTRILAPNDVTHSIWRGHNREPIFKGNYKAAYLKMLADEVQRSDVDIHSFCMMNNHSHQVNRSAMATDYSNLYQKVHSRFAQTYNRQENRCGAVGMGRPKSLVIQNEEYLATAMFYVDANPVRAGVVKHPMNYRWGSYNYYAFGRSDPNQPTITPPEWYMKLGKDSGSRQRAYRRLFDAYLRGEGLLPKPGLTLGYYVGDPLWIEKRRRRHKSKCQSADMTEAMLRLDSS
jgi:putative transposase